MIIPETATSALIVIDMQERLINAMKDADKCLARAKVLLKGANLLGLDTLMTEQYPKGLGHASEYLSAVVDQNKTPVVEKTSFSCFGSPEFNAELQKKSRKSLFICGIESHVCVLQTVIDAKNSGYNVFVISDAVASRKQEDLDRALELMQKNGIDVISTETMLFMLMGSSKHPEFKKISELIK
ncbi:MAG: isochorismatase family protein [Lentisphaerae bacterium]|nr:isochorismatase family protein [Lentisphaerota bacterium]MCP4102988.1 isochorismatase family protein [Lentisphaerota bacterium]